MQRLSPSDPRIRWLGAGHLKMQKDGATPSRLPLNHVDLLHPDLRPLIWAPSGVRLGFQCSSRHIVLKLTADAQTLCHFDLVVEDQICQTLEAERGRPSTLTFTRADPNMKRCEIWFPPQCDLTIHEIGIDDGATCDPLPDDRPKWLAYGSSITFCHQKHLLRPSGSASGDAGIVLGPASTWPAIVAREHNLDLTNLGFGGQCHFDPVIARIMAAMPADQISLELGVNTWVRASFSLRTWTPAVLGFILTLRDGHPQTPLLIISPIYSCQRETTPNATGLTLAWMREQLAELVATLRDRGDDQIYYLDGLQLFGHADWEAGHMPDELHPNGQGFAIMAERFAERAFGRIHCRS